MSETPPNPDRSLALMEAWPPGPERPDRPGPAVHVWRADLDRLPAPAEELLPESERRRAERLRSPEQRRRWVVSRWALRELLGRYLGERPAAIQLRLGERGKPSLAAASALRFNLSHCGGLALVALTEAAEIGVDVESIDRRRDVVRLAEMALEPEQVEQVRAAAPDRRGEVFHRAWAEKEATVKCFGLGLGSPPPRAPVAVTSLPLGGDHAAAVALAKAGMPAPRRFELNPPLRAT